MCLSHPETIPPPCPVCGKIIFHETGPWCQKFGDCCFKEKQAVVK